MSGSPLVGILGVFLAMHVSLSGPPQSAAWVLGFPRFPQEYSPKDDSERALVEQFVERGRVVVGRWTDKLKRKVPNARVVDLPGAGHYVFLTKEADVLREIHSFVAALPMSARK